MHLALYQDEPASQAGFDRLTGYSLLDRLKALDYKICRKGLAALDPGKNPLIGLGMELAGGRVTRSGYGVFNLAWRAGEHPEWAESINCEVEDIRAAIRKAHGAPLRYLICAGPGGWGEDKLAFKGAGLLNRGPRCYVLDSDSPGCLNEILDDISARSGTTLALALKSALVVGPATDSVERLSALYKKLRIDGRANFIRLELPPDVLTARHAAPLTRSSLYPLGLARVDLRSWIEGASLTEAEILTVWRLSAFLDAQGRSGRDKVTLMPAKAWTGAAQWTRRALEEGLGAGDGHAVAVVADEPVRLANYHPPKAAGQDRLFLAVLIKGEPGPDSGKVALLRRIGYPVAVLTFERSSPLSKYMQAIHYLAFGAAWLRGAGFVARPSNDRQAPPDPSPHRAEWSGGVGLQFRYLPKEVRQKLAGLDGPSCYAVVLRSLADRRRIDCGEWAVTGEVRYSEVWRAMGKCLERAAERIFRSLLKMPASFRGEVASTRRGAFFTLVTAGQTAPSGQANPHLVISLREASERAVQALDSFFGQTATALKRL